MRPPHNLLAWTFLVLTSLACGGSPEKPDDALLTSSIASGSHAFGAQPVGQASSALVWTLTNTGDLASGPLDIVLSGNASGDFSQTQTCSGPLAGGQSCAITVVYTPSALSATTATVDVSATPGGSLSLALSGNGVIRLTLITSGTGQVSTSDGKLTACTGTCVADYTEPSTELTVSASTSNGSDAYFKGWEGLPCISPVPSCDLTLTDSVQGKVFFGSYATSGNLAFLTSSVYATNLGASHSTYDNACNQLATAAGINNSEGNLYIAWISTASSGDGLALTRLENTSRGWVRLDGKVLADAQSSFINASSPAWLNPVAFDERGKEVVEDGYLLTGTQPNGTLGNNCNSWSGSGSFFGGLSHGGGKGWTAASNYTCSTSGRLLCLMKGRTAPLTIPDPPSGARKLFLSNGMYTPGAGTTPDAHCSAELSGAKALIATTTTTAGSLLNASTVYVRPDGIVIGTGAQIVAGQLQSGLWQHLDGTYAIGSDLSFTPWTGATTLLDLGTTSSTCADWSSGTTGSPYVGESLASRLEERTRYWWYYGSGGCGQARALYCFEP